MIKAVLFDLGDTLVLNYATKDKINKSELTYKLFSKRGVNVLLTEFLNAEEYAKYVYDVEYDGKVERFEAGFFYEQIGKKLGLSHPRKFYAEIDDIIQTELINNLQTPEKLHETLEELKKMDLKLAVISNGHRRTVLKKLEYCNLKKFFELVFISYDLGEDKSSLTAFKKIVEELKVFPNECLMIGDRLDEDMYARKVGMWTALVKYVPAKKHLKR